MASQNYTSKQVVASGVISASGSSAVFGVNGPNYDPPLLAQGYSAAIFSQDVTVVTASGVVDEEVQGNIASQTDYFLLTSAMGNAPMQFPEASATGANMLAYFGVVPENMKTVYKLVSGTSITRSIGLAVVG